MHKPEILTTCMKLGENVSLLPVEESEPVTKNKKKLPPDQYSEECIHEQGQSFPSHMGDFWSDIKLL